MINREITVTNLDGTRNIYVEDPGWNTSIQQDWNTVDSIRRAISTYGYGLESTNSYSDWITVTINTYEQAMEYDGDKDFISIKTDVLRQLTNRINELERHDAEYWTKLLSEET